MKKWFVEQLIYYNDGKDELFINYNIKGRIQ